MMCTCHVERSEAKSKHLQKDTIPLGSACSERFFDYALRASLRMTDTSIV